MPWPRRRSGRRPLPEPDRARDAFQGLAWALPNVPAEGPSLTRELDRSPAEQGTNPPGDGSDGWDQPGDGPAGAALAQGSTDDEGSPTQDTVPGGGLAPDDPWDCFARADDASAGRRLGRAWAGFAPRAPAESTGVPSERSPDQPDNSPSLASSLRCR